MKCITYIRNNQPLNTDNYTLTYIWTPGDTAYILCREQDIRQMHRVFGHPTIMANEKQLNSAIDNTLKPDERKMIKKIAQSCHICRINASPPDIQVNGGTVQTSLQSPITSRHHVTTRQPCDPHGVRSNPLHLWQLPPFPIIPRYMENHPKNVDNYLFGSPRPIFGRSSIIVQVPGNDPGSGVHVNIITISTIWIPCHHPSKYIFWATPTLFNMYLYTEYTLTDVFQRMFIKRRTSGCIIIHACITCTRVQV